MVQVNRDIRISIPTDSKMAAENSKNTHYTKSTLLQRGWSKSLIERFLGKPDKESLNPHYRNSSPLKLFLIERVEKVESNPAFQVELDKTKKRSIDRKIVAEKIRDKTLDWARSLHKPDFEKLSKESLLSEACEHYNDLWHSRGEPDKHASINASDRFLHRITVNYLRHVQSDYEWRLLESRGKIGTREAKIIIKHHILDAISETYPWLKRECETQKLLAEIR